MLRWLGRFVVVALCAQFAGCYASFSAFHSVEKWNGKAAESRVATSAIHMALWILPVYELVLLGDVLIFNTVEYWSGKKVFGGGGGEETAMRALETGYARLERGGVTYELVALDRDVVGIIADGLMVGEAQQQADQSWDLRVYGSHTELHLSPEQVAQAQRLALPNG